eukprot:TRINITY_DN12494_c0_g1_i1.p1 TRINITY_DN12494_c0_g1~~TRINITY_DN12494_c0_g1_i1.p1  ORF type:complete len:147 (+),score=8.40 TRINITY_DN12494_c0_g1_i1:434-874(+)
MERPVQDDLVFLAIVFSMNLATNFIGRATLFSSNRTHISCSRGIQAGFEGARPEPDAGNSALNFGFEARKCLFHISKSFSFPSGSAKRRRIPQNAKKSISDSRALHLRGYRGRASPKSTQFLATCLSPSCFLRQVTVGTATSGLLH